MILIYGNNQNKNNNAVIINCVFDILSCVLLGAIYFFDSLPREFATPQYRFLFLALIAGGACYYLSTYYIMDYAGNVTIVLFKSFHLEIISIVRSSFAAMAIFYTKNCIMSYVKPNHFVMLTTSLCYATEQEKIKFCERHASTPNLGVVDVETDVK